MSGNYSNYRGHLYGVRPGAARARGAHRRPGAHRQAVAAVGLARRAVALWRAYERWWVALSGGGVVGVVALLAAERGGF